MHKNSTISPLQSFVQIKSSVVTHMNNTQCDKFLHSSQECDHLNNRSKVKGRSHVLSEFLCLVTILSVSWIFAWCGRSSLYSWLEAQYGVESRPPSSISATSCRDSTNKRCSFIVGEHIFCISKVLSLLGLTASMEPSGLIRSWNGGFEGFQ